MGSVTQPAAESKINAIKAELISSTPTVTPGKPFTLGVLFKIKPGWHTYWQYAGDAGLPPEIEWKLPDGWSAGRILWPVPTKFTEKGPLTTYGYRDSVLLMTEVTPPATSSGISSAVITANVDWLVCHDECVPGKATLSLNLPISNTGSISKQSSVSSNPRFRHWQQQLPVDPKVAGLITSLEAKRADDSDKIAKVTFRISHAGGAVSNIVDWLPSPTEDFAVKKVIRTEEKAGTVFSFLFQSFKGPIPSGAELESLVVYRDGNGMQGGAAIVSQIKINP